MYNEAPALVSCEDHCLAANGLGCVREDMFHIEKFVYYNCRSIVAGDSNINSNWIYITKMKFSWMAVG